MNLKIGHKIKQWSHHVKQEDLNSWSKILNDPNPIHFDADAVKKIGQGDKCINQCVGRIQEWPRNCPRI